MSAFIEIIFHDFRSPNIILNNLQCREANLTNLPYADCSLENVSCMHTLEHIGLGRYGDPIDPSGDVTAANELQRVLTPGGLLIFVVPVGIERLQFNAHRIYSHERILKLFPKLTSISHALIPDNALDVGIISDPDPKDINNQVHGCGCFIFQKPL